MFASLSAMVHEFDMTGSPRIRLYVDAPLAADATVAATTDQAHYLRRVMRRGPGDAVALFNGRDGEWRAVIAEVAGKGCVMSVESRMRPQAPGPDPWLLFAPVKRQGVDFLARKATELGVARLQPVFTHRTAVSRVNVARLRANAVEAAEQCGRLDVPEVRDPMPLDAALENWPRARRLFWADEIGGGAAPQAFAGATTAALLIGPEGGFSDDERARLRGHAAATAIDLGPRILRADTAALAALALWQATAGDWGA